MSPMNTLEILIQELPSDLYQEAEDFVRFLLTKRAARKSVEPVKDKSTLAREAFGMWAKRPEINDEWLINSRAQWQSQWHDE